MPERISGRGQGGDLRLSVREIDASTLKERFPVGSVMKGRISGVLGEGKYILSIAGLRLVAESGGDLAIGERLRLRVVAAEPRVHLARVPEGGEAEAGILKGMRIADNPENRAVLKALLDAGESITASRFKAVIGIMKRTGASAEAAVRLFFLSRDNPGLEITPRLVSAAESLVSGDDAGAILSRLISLIPSAKGKKITRGLILRGNSASDLRELVEYHPSRHEAMVRKEGRGSESKAVLLRLSSSTGEEADLARRVLDNIDSRRIFAPPGEFRLPFFVEDKDGSLQEGEMSFRRGRDRTTVVLDLDTSHLGRVRAVMDLEEVEIGASFGALGEEAVRALKEGREDLAESLRSIGRNLTAFSVDLVKRKEEAEAIPVLGLDLRI